MVRTIFTAFIIATVYSLVWPHVGNNVRIDLVVLLLSTSPGALDLLMIIRLMKDGCYSQEWSKAKRSIASGELVKDARAVPSTEHAHHDLPRL